MTTRVDSQISHEFTFHMVFAITLKMAIPITAFFAKNFENHKNLKIQEFTLVLNLVSFPQKWQFRLKNESFEISGNSSYVYVWYNFELKIFKKP